MKISDMKSGIFLAAIADSAALTVLWVTWRRLTDISLIFAFLPVVAACVVLAYTFLAGNNPSLAVRLMWLAGVVGNTAVLLQAKSVLLWQADPVPAMLMLSSDVVLVILYFYTGLIARLQRKRLIKELKQSNVFQNQVGTATAHSEVEEGAERTDNTALDTAPANQANGSADSTEATELDAPTQEHTVTPEPASMDRRRFELLGLEYPDTDAYGTMEFSDLEFEALEKLINEGFLPAHQRLGNSSVKIQELYNFLRDHKNFHVSGLVSDAHNGACIYVNTVEGASDDDEEKLSFLEKFRQAKEYWRKGSLLYAYFA